MLGDSSKVNETKPSTAKYPRQLYKRDPATTIVYVLLIFLLSQLFAGLLVASYPALKGWTGEQGTAWLESSVYAQFIYILVAEFLTVWFTIKFARKAGAKLSQLGIKKPHLKDVAYALAGYGIYFVIYLIVIIIASQFSSFINLDQAQDIGFESATGTGNLLIVYLSLAILPPIAEEVLFRGYLFSSLRAKYRLRYAAIITSILFGIAHLQFGSGAPLLWVAAIDTFVLSMVLCYLRERTGSIGASVMLHILKNSIAFVALFHSRF